MAAGEYPGEVPAAKTLRFLVGARGRCACGSHVFIWRLCWKEHSSTLSVLLSAC